MTKKLKNSVQIAILLLSVGCSSVPTISSRKPAGDTKHATQDSSACDVRMTDVKSALSNLDTTWNISRKVARGWEVSVPEGSSRSSYEIYTRFAGLGFVLGISPNEMMQTLHDSGEVGPAVDRGWDWQDYSRMAEAALVRNSSLDDAMQFMKATWIACKRSGWEYLDISRISSAGFIAGSVTPETACNTLNDVYNYATSGNWTYGSYSRVAEGALIAGVSVAEAAKMLDDVYAAARTLLSTGWSDDDYARVARTALLAKISGLDAMRILKQIYELSNKSWNYRDYSRMAAAAIVANKSAEEAAKALKDSWDNRKLIGGGWKYADFATTAAAGLIGAGSQGAPICGAYLKAW